MNTILPIESLAELKRTLKAGMKITLVETNVSGLNPVEGKHKYLNIPRTITKVQTNSFAMATDEQLAKGEIGSWMDFPKANMIKFYCDDVFKIMFDYPTQNPLEIRRDVFTYKLERG